MKFDTNNILTIIALVVAVLSFVMITQSLLVNTYHAMLDNQSKNEVALLEHTGQFSEAKEGIISKLIVQGDYACCLEKPCTYCIEKTPKHGEGPTCSCLDDVMNGRHPCGECIGEILEGHGNKYISRYFATSIAEEVGMKHIGTIREIIESKYGIPVEEQE
ncbi:MAG: hypothetical protein GF349_01325 [Candidatus Magasanikbacteria bacterium]|nr:hypothetical protein [Candidatus Magasanikbacteria bacterium]